MEAQGLWINILCYMFESPKRGTLRSGKKIWKKGDILNRVLGATSELIDELIGNGVLHKSIRLKVFYSKRLIRDERKRRMVKRRVKRHRMALRNAPVTRSVTPIEYEYESVTRDISLKEKNKKEEKKTIQCPHKEIISLYHEILPMLPRIRVWNGQNEANLQSRWREEKERQDLTWWKSLFTNICKMEFLIGKNEQGWKAHLGWIVRPYNFSKILNGVYEIKKKTEEERWFV